LKIVLVIVSSLRADHLGLYGNSWLKTPAFENLGKRGKVFTQAQCRQANPIGTRREILTGLDFQRFSETPCLRPELTLPGQFQTRGFRTALFSDNFPTFPLYETVQAFDTIFFVPGQGYDPHLPGIPSRTLDPGLSTSIVTGSPRLPKESELQNYLRNRSFHPHLGHPAVRLFAAVNEYLKNSDAENEFLLVDSYGLQPPWDSLPEFARFRTAEDLNDVAWPVPGPFDPQHKNTHSQLNFLRRAYADSCLFLDHLLGKMATDGITLWVMSDQGTLIGDDNGLIHQPGRNSMLLTKQVLIAAGPLIETGSRCGDPVTPLDLFPTLLNLAGMTHLPPNDGKIIQNLMI
jgi:arylsulfatase A-like enzyme